MDIFDWHRDKITIMTNWHFYFSKYGFDLTMTFIVKVKTIFNNKKVYPGPCLPWLLYRVCDVKKISIKRNWQKSISDYQFASVFANIAIIILLNITNRNNTCIDSAVLLNIKGIHRNNLQETRKKLMSETYNWHLVQMKLHGGASWGLPPPVKLENLCETFTALVCCKIPPKKKE